MGGIGKLVCFCDERLFILWAMLLFNCMDEFIESHDECILP
jgi:hypothetical protein